jgi:HK97 family phage portal protein
MDEPAVEGGEEHMGKKKKKNIRAKPEKQSGVFVYSGATFADFLLPSGYIKMSDNPEVRIAVDKIADLVSNMTIHLMENTNKGDKRIKNELSRKIDINPCRHMTRKTWLYKIASDLLLFGDGNSIVFPVLKDGLLEELKPLVMQDVGYNYDDEDGEYSISYRGVTYSSDEILHFAINPSPRYPWKGTGYRVVLGDLIQNLKQANKTKGEFMRGGYMPNVIIKVDAMNEDMATEAGREQIKKKYLGEAKPGEPWIIPTELIDVQSVKPLSLEDIAINPSVEIDKKTVAGILGVPAFFLGVGEFNKDEYNNFVDTRIMSIAQIIAQTLTRDLLYSPNLYFKLNPRSLYAYNLNDMVTAGTAMIDRNAMRRNELRDWVGMDPDDEMEELIALENYIPVAKLGDQKKLKGGDE